MRSGRYIWNGLDSKERTKKYPAFEIFGRRANLEGITAERLVMCHAVLIVRAESGVLYVLYSIRILYIPG